MKLPRLWKNLKRHPLSDEYPDLTRAAAERMLAGVKKHKIVNGRRMTIHEGMVLDGWQLYQACIEANVKPEAQPLPNGMTAEEYVELVNDTRRHETQELAIARAVSRRERVATAKVAGTPNVQIAADEGVAESTIRNDLKVLRSQGANVDPPDGQITDSKGRQQPAGKPKKTQKGKPRTLKQAVDAETNGELRDEIDGPVPPGLRTVFEDAAIFRGILSQFREIKAAINKLSERPAGLSLHRQDVEMALDNARRAIRFAMPYAVCPVCSGSGKNRKSNCPCKGVGWLAEDNYNVLPQEYRQ